MKPNFNRVTICAAVLTLSAAHAGAPETVMLTSARVPGISVGTNPGIGTLADEDDALSRTRLRKLFENTEWVSEKMPGGVQPRRLAFRRNGEVDDSTPGGKYKFFTVESPNILKLYRGDPKKKREADFVFLRVNVAAKTAEQDAKASTIGGQMILKFDGPAKSKQGVGAP